MRQIENRPVEELQFRLGREEGFGILPLILTAKGSQKPFPFRGLKNSLQRGKPIGFATLFPGKIPCDSEKIPFPDSNCSIVPEHVFSRIATNTPWVRSSATATDPVICTRNQ